MATLNEKIKMLSGSDFWHTCSFDDVPKMMVSDGPHGLRKQDIDGDCKGVNESITAVCFPTASCLASSFDNDLAKYVGGILGEECCAEEVSVLLGPAINIKRSPLCGRNFEYFSEDPYLAGTIAKNYINGVQEKGVGTSIKHFAANNQEKRRLTVSAEIDERALREIYLKGFEIAIKGAQPKTVMCSYNKINGVYSSENKWLLTDLLRDEWGFKGFVMSDWGAVNERYKAVKAGLDLEMPASYSVGENNIHKALENNLISEEEIDKSYNAIADVAKSIKFGDYTFDREEHHKIAKEVAKQSMVLLKNEKSVLPLKQPQNIAFIGGFAANPRFQGGGSSHIKAYKVKSAVELCPNIPYAKGFSAVDNTSDFDEEEYAIKLASNADIAVVFAGLPDSFESEAFDRKDMSLPSVQNRLIERISAVNDNVVVVLHNGSPVEMPWINSVSAVLEAYLGGEASHEAVVDILFGKSNPCGKLAETFPKKIYDNSSYFNFPGNGNTVEYRESIFVGYRYYDAQNVDVLFPFGYGLSYTTFEYSDIELKGNTISYRIKNTGKVAGSEISQLYISNSNCKVFKAPKELKHYAKTFLNPGEIKTISIELTPEDFTYYNVQRGEFVIENGIYDILIGASSRDIKLTIPAKVDGIKDVPYSDEVNDLYKNTDQKFITNGDFEKLLGRKIEVNIPSVPYDLNCTIGDITDTFCGKVINKAIDVMFSSKNSELGSGEIEKAFALETPVRNLASMSNGAVTEDMADCLCNVLNDKNIISSLVKFAGYGIKNLIKRK